MAVTLAPMTQVTFTLSILAYTDETPKFLESSEDQELRMFGDINAQLAQLAPGWSVVWGPALSPTRANMMYVAANSSTNEYAIAIRGTDVKDFLDLFEDLRTRQLTPYAYLDNANIANGTNEAFGILQAMTGFTDGNKDGGTTTLDAFISSVTPATLYVTGHSLGGCLSTVVAPWMAKSGGVAPANIQVYTYAAPSAGDQGFADAFNTMFDAAATPPRTYRYYNTIDVVPNAWQTLANIVSLFPQPAPPAPPEVSATVNCALKGLPAYVQVGIENTPGVIPLAGIPTIPITPGGGNGLTGTTWFAEAEYQHSGPNYQQLLGLEQTSSVLAKFAARAAATA
ncbi:MAG TPA: lipase family protein [Thermoanaerobaculia bacterium]|nr:lipase family protein [Thermoanaerobaculia bacterium]